MDSLFSFDDNDVDDDDEKSYFEKSEDGVNLKKKELTMYNKPPFILNCTIRYECILGATCEIFSIIVYHWDKCENAESLITGF
jgi:hypothetical protein